MSHWVFGLSLLTRAKDVQKKTSTGVETMLVSLIWVVTLPPKLAGANQLHTWPTSVTLQLIPGRVSDGWVDVRAKVENKGHGVVCFCRGPYRWMVTSKMADGTRPVPYGSTIEWGVEKDADWVVLFPSEAISFRAGYGQPGAAVLEASYDAPRKAADWTKTRGAVPLPSCRATWSQAIP